MANIPVIAEINNLLDADTTAIAKTALGVLGAVTTSGALGTPTSGTLTNATDLPIVAGTSGTLTVARGGTGAATLAANNVLLGNGTTALQAVAPSTSGNVLTSNGSTWQSLPAATAGNLTSGPVTSSSGASAIADSALSIAKTSGLQTALDAKQASLVSGTNIRTVNGSTLLGSTDLVISGSTPAAGSITPAMLETGAAVANITANTLPLAKISTANATENFVLTSTGPDQAPAWEVIPASGGGLAANGTQATLRTARVSGYNRIVNPSKDAWRIMNKIAAKKGTYNEAGRFRISVLGDSVAADPLGYAQSLFGKGGEDIRPNEIFARTESTPNSLTGGSAGYASWSAGAFLMSDAYTRTSTGMIIFLDSSITNGVQIDHLNNNNVLCHSFVVRYLSGPTTGGAVTGDSSYGSFKLQYKINHTGNFIDCTVGAVSSGGGQIASGVVNTNSGVAERVSQVVFNLPKTDRYEFRLVCTAGRVRFTQMLLHNGGMDAAYTANTSTPQINNNGAMSFYHGLSGKRLSVEFIQTPQSVWNDVLGFDDPHIVVYKSLNGYSINDYTTHWETYANRIMSAAPNALFVVCGSHTYGASPLNYSADSVAVDDYLADWCGNRQGAVFIDVRQNYPEHNRTILLSGATGTNFSLINNELVSTGTLVNGKQSYSFTNASGTVTMQYNGSAWVVGVSGTPYFTSLAVSAAGYPLTGGGGTGGAIATAVLTNGAVTGFNISSGGTGYTSAPPVVITGGGGSGATATANLTNGAVTSITITAGGTGYTSAPTITFGGFTSSNGATGTLVFSDYGNSVRGIDDLSVDGVHISSPAQGSDYVNSLIWETIRPACESTILSTGELQKMIVKAPYAFNQIDLSLRDHRNSVASTQRNTLSIKTDPYFASRVVTRPLDATYNGGNQSFTEGGGFEVSPSFVETDSIITPSSCLTLISSGFRQLRFGRATGVGYTGVIIGQECSLSRAANGFRVLQPDVADKPSIVAEARDGCPTTTKVFGIDVQANKTAEGFTTHAWHTDHTEYLGAQGTGATAIAVLGDGSIGTVHTVNSVTVTNKGHSYLNNVPTISFTGGVTGGAVATAVLTSGAVTGFTISNGGTAGIYNTPPPVVITGGGGSGAAATAVLTNGVVTSITITAGGTGYTSVPTIAFVTHATAIATIGSQNAPALLAGKVTAITMSSPGSGYTSAPTVVITPALLLLSGSSRSAKIEFTIETPQNTQTAKIHTPINQTEGTGDLKRIIGVIPSYATAAAGIAAVDAGDVYYDEATKKVKVRLT